MDKSAFESPRRALRPRAARTGITTVAKRIEIKMSFRIAERPNEAHRRTSSQGGLAARTGPRLALVTAATEAACGGAELGKYRSRFARCRGARGEDRRRAPAPAIAVRARGVHCTCA